MANTSKATLAHRLARETPISKIRHMKTASKRATRRGRTRILRPTNVITLATSFATDSYHSPWTYPRAINALVTLRPSG